MRPTRLIGAALGAVLAVWMIGSIGDPHLASRLIGAALGGLAVGALVLRVPGARKGADDGADGFEAVWHRSAAATRAPALPAQERLRGLVRLSIGTAGDAHNRLRPLLRDLADARLDALHGTHLDRDAQAAQRLGPEVWAWVRPDRPHPLDRLGPGPGSAELEAVIAGLERAGSLDEGGPMGRADPVRRGADREEG